MTIIADQFCASHFYVPSRKRADVVHEVDLEMRVDKWEKPQPACTCEAFLANPHTRGKPCPHILAVLDLQARIERVRKEFGI